MALVTTILMASGKVGRSAIEEIQEKYKDKVEIRAASRDPEKLSDELKNMKDVKWVKAHVGGDKEDMKVSILQYIIFKSLKIMSLKKN